MGLLRVGECLRDTYEVERFLAEGAFGEVYRVRHKFLGRQAMKVLKQPHMTPGEIEDTMAEAVLLSQIGHPNIVRVFDANLVETERGTLGFFTMEYVAGGSLHSFWRSHGHELVPINTTLELVKQVCRGLSVAHAESPPVIHRDIKPQNVLVGYEVDGLRARLSDFGLAKRANPLTLMASAAGTLAFKPPESFMSDGGDSVAADLWGVGVTLYLLLTDRLPYRVEAVGVPHDGASHSAAPPAPSRFNPDCDERLDRVVARCLHQDPGRRYHDAAALLDALEAWAGGRTPDSASHGSQSRFLKDAMGPGVAPNAREAEAMVQEAMREAARPGKLAAAADMMEEAFNRWPSLRGTYARRLQLWRRGISM